MSLYIALCSVTCLPLLLILTPLLLLPLLLLIPKKTRSSLPPSPPKLPIIGHLHHFGELPHHSLRLLSQKYGPLMQLQLGRVPTLVLSSAEVARGALKSHEAAICSRPALTQFKKLTYDFSDLAFSPYTDYSKEIRKIFSIHLLSPTTVKSFGFVRGEEVAFVVRSIANRCSCILNLSEMMDSLNQNIMCRVVLGRSYEGGSEGEKKRLHGILEETGKILGRVFVGDLLPWLWWVDVVSGMRGRLERSSVELDAFYERVIEDHLDPKRGRAEEEEDFVDVLLRARKELLLSREQVKSMLMVGNPSHT